MVIPRGCGTAFALFLLCPNRRWSWATAGEKMLAADTLPGHVDQETAEERLWRAVIASTVWEWTHGPLRRRKEAEHFLFHDESDFKLVCLSAGIDPLSLRERLEKLRERSQLRLEEVAAFI
jgi:hypothetical protein